MDKPDPHVNKDLEQMRQRDREDRRKEGSGGMEKVAKM